MPIPPKCPPRIPWPKPAPQPPELDPAVFSSYEKYSRLKEPKFKKTCPDNQATAGVAG